MNKIAFLGCLQKFPLKFQGHINFHTQKNGSDIFLHTKLRILLIFCLHLSNYYIYDSTEGNKYFFWLVQFTPILGVLYKCIKWNRKQEKYIVTTKLILQETTPKMA